MQASTQDITKPIAIKLTTGGVTTFTLPISKPKANPTKTVLGYQAIEKIQVQGDEEVHSFAFNKLHDGYNTEQEPAVLFSESLAADELLLVISGLFAGKVSYTKLTKDDPSWQKSIEALARCSFPTEKVSLDAKPHGHFHIYILSAVGDKAENFEEYYEYFYDMIDKYNINKACKAYIRPPLEHPSSYLGLINYDHSDQNYEILSRIDGEFFESCQVVGLEDLFTQSDNFA
jgi:hypothetical protein